MRAKVPGRILDPHVKGGKSVSVRGDVNRQTSAVNKKPETVENLTHAEGLFKHVYLKKGDF